VKFFEPENVNDLADAMLTLIKDQNQRKIQFQNALHFVENFRWDRRKDEYLDLADRLVHEK